MKAEREITNEYNRKESEDFEEKVRDEAGRSGGKDKCNPADDIQL